MIDYELEDYPDYCPKTGYQACSECPAYDEKRDCCTDESSDAEGYLEVCED